MEHDLILNVADYIWPTRQGRLSPGKEEAALKHLGGLVEKFAWIRFRKVILLLITLRWRWSRTAVDLDQLVGEIVRRIVTKPRQTYARTLGGRRRGVVY